jgi:hypothetical protein
MACQLGYLHFRKKVVEQMNTYFHDNQEKNARMIADRFIEILKHLPNVKEVNVQIGISPEKVEIEVMDKTKDSELP